MSDTDNSDKPAKRILMIDDDTDLCEYCTALLEKEGYQVESVNTGEEGREKAHATLPDLIIVDMMMESWSEGSIVVENLHNSEDTKSIPIILMTAVDMSSPMNEMTPQDTLDVNAYIVKPINPEKLLAHIKRILGT